MGSGHSRLSPEAKQTLGMVPAYVANMYNVLRLIPPAQDPELQRDRPTKAKILKERDQAVAAQMIKAALHDEKLHRAKAVQARAFAEMCITTEDRSSRMTQKLVKLQDYLNAIKTVTDLQIENTKERNELYRRQAALREAQRSALKAGAIRHPVTEGNSCDEIEGLVKQVVTG
ncbi:hypothetical protein P154DRAFT_580270 [Amniculicola lignicola CBS 123094]|uniref:Uncharacterized protein n=1 Tax=Amniculicola lignicola CBS 123094 TaxID=1392246 RepID=A0A6A5W4L8_9PLEO|nr:hypothetical protein P154DRAFT_580270 [Amniculicola lignicola CBS 123094]